MIDLEIIMTIFDKDFIKIYYKLYFNHKQGYLRFKMH